jgi:hypothetical protein
MFSPIVGKSKCSQALSEVSYFFDSENPRIFSIPNRIFRETGTNFFNTHKTGTVPGKPGQMGSLLTAYVLITEAYSWGQSQSSATSQLCKITDLSLQIRLHGCQRCTYDRLYIDGEKDITDTIHSYLPQTYLTSLRNLSGYEAIFREISLYTRERYQRYRSASPPKVTRGQPHVNTHFWWLSPVTAVISRCVY